MKLHRIYAIVLAAVAAITTGCERDLEFKSDENVPENIALSVVADPDTTFEVMAARTYLFSRLNGNYNPNEVFEKASSLRFGHVYFSVNGGSQTEMVYDETTHRFRSDYHPKTGDRIDVTASAPDLPTVSGFTTVPSKPKIEILEVKTTKLPNDPFSSYSYQYSNKAEIRLRITDPAESGNYYRLIVQSYDKTTLFDGKNPSFYNNVYYSTDDMFKDTDIYAERGEWAQYFSDVFSDHKFNGKTHEFTVITKIAANKLEDARLTIDLQSITREMYFYLKSLMVYAVTPQDEYTEAIQIYSNVNEGWGIVGAANTDHHIIDF